MGDMLKGDSAGVPVNVSTAQQMQALAKYLPRVMQSFNSQVGPTAEAGFAAQQAVSPKEQALNARMYQQFSPLYQQQNNQNNLESLQGTGGQAALAGQQLNKQIDPEYYKTREASANGLRSLLTNPISGGESAAIERANNAGQISGGNFGLNSNATQLGAAMNYGAAGRDRLGQAIGLATNAAPTFKSGVDAFGQATGQTGTQGGMQQNQIGNTNSGNQAFGSGGQLLGQIGAAQGLSQNVNANRRTVYDAVNQSYSAAGSGTSGCMSCYIFQAKYHKDVPHWVRWARDFFYQGEDGKAIRLGYVRCGKAIIPLMRKYSWFMNLVNKFMLFPLVQYGGWMYNIKGYESGRKYIKYKKFWLGFWKLIGKI